MRIHLCLLASSVAALGSPPTQPPTEDQKRNSGLVVYLGGSSSEFMLSWWGYDENFYFIATSDDLEEWTLLPTVELGEDAAITLGFDLAQASKFWKLDYSDDPDSDLLSTDYNVIGLSAWNQLQLGYNPFDWVDTDDNDLHDAWELHHFNFIGVDPSVDSSGDGQTNLQAFQNGTDPTAQSHPSVGLIVFTR